MIDDFEAVRPDEEIDAEERERRITRQPDDQEDPYPWEAEFRPYLDDPA